MKIFRRGNPHLFCPVDRHEWAMKKAAHEEEVQDITDFQLERYRQYSGTATTGEKNFFPPDIQAILGERELDEDARLSFRRPLCEWATQVIREILIFQKVFKDERLLPRFPYNSPLREVMINLSRVARDFEEKVVNVREINRSLVESRFSSSRMRELQQNRACIVVQAADLLVRWRKELSYDSTGLIRGCFAVSRTNELLVMASDPWQRLRKQAKGHRPQGVRAPYRRRP